MLCNRDTSEHELQKCEYQEKVVSYQCNNTLDNIQFWKNNSHGKILLTMRLCTSNQIGKPIGLNSAEFILH